MFLVLSFLASSSHHPTYHQQLVERALFLKQENLESDTRSIIYNYRDHHKRLNDSLCLTQTNVHYLLHNYYYFPSVIRHSNDIQQQQMATLTLSLQNSCLIGCPSTFPAGLGLITIVIVIDCNRLHFLCNHNRNHTFSKLDVIVIMLCNHL